jgi:uncharacterized membrane protein YraQ (UPF0718 family)
MSDIVGNVSSLAVSTIVGLAFASSIKTDQMRFERMLSELDQRKQLELLELVQKTSSELERQAIVSKFINDAKIQELKSGGNKNKTIIYVVLGVAILAYGIMIFKFKKR